MLLMAGVVHAASVLFVATGNVPAGKFHQLDEIARPLGLKVEVRFLNSLPSDVDGGLWRGYDAVFFDSYLQDEVRAHLARALPSLAVPNAWLYDARPAWGGGLPETVAQRLIRYYGSGGRQNFEGFFVTLAAQLQGRDAMASAPDPVVFPKTGVYHPRTKGLVMADPVAYLRTQGSNPPEAGRRPVIGISLHQQYIASMQTVFIDDLIARIEAAGGIALPFYTPMLDAGGFTRVLQPGGEGSPVLADALINTQIILNADERRAEFTRMGIPVVQAMAYRRGGEAEWAANPQGVPLMDVPFYLAQPEYAGVVDIQVTAATRAGDEQIMPISAQAAALVGKAMNMVKLQRKANSEKRLAVFFWNYPPGEKNFSASFLNVPRSMQAMLSALRGAGYDTEPQLEDPLVEKLQRLLAPAYRDGMLAPLLRDNLAERLPVKEYRTWLATLPAATQIALKDSWGAPEDSSMVLREDGQAFFVIPRLLLGKLALLPQPPRGEKWADKEKSLYHSTSAWPSHHYLAVYLWARQHAGDAFVHFGTHGTQEWLPGKERGLAVTDPGMLAVGDVPVAYPYIADNIGEAQQARRRGRAVIVSHQTPPFQPAGLHAQLTDLHDLLHAWMAQDEGAVKDRIAVDLLASADKQRIVADMGTTTAQARADFPAFANYLHAHLHELAETAQPLGLHSLGVAPADTHRLGTVLLMLGRPYWEAAARHAGTKPEDVDETLVGDYERMAQTAPYQLLERHLIQSERDDALPAPLRAQMAQARQWWQAIGAQNEFPALLAVLAGRYLETSYGGDPIKNPDAYPTGRNLYGFDPSRVPTLQAWEAGKQAAEQLIAAYREQHGGRAPEKITFSLWSVETMRHQGMLEAQALWLMGVEPVWDKGGRVTGVRLVPRQTLGRARVDVVLSATGLYRDHFPNAMQQLARAVQLAAKADEPDNPLAANARAIASRLRARGMEEGAALRAGQTRIFSSESGRYGTGLDDAVLATDTWKGKEEGDRKLAELYLSRMQYAYGPDESEWGSLPAGGQGAAGNLYAEHLGGTQAAVLSRSSNTYGMLTTDDPFQYLGGIGLAVRHLDGKAPQLFISNLRGSGSGRVEGAAQFLAKELATRQFHPGYIKGLMKEGYAGTLQVLDATNNFWGWTAAAREIVRDDQWQEMADVYVKDKHRLGLDAWFERHNPHALAQTIERMLEAARQGYWQADKTSVRDLKNRWSELSRRFDVRSDNARFTAFVAEGTSVRASGFGLDAPALVAAIATKQEVTPQPSSEPQAEPDSASTQPEDPPQVSGMRLTPVQPAEPPLPFKPAAAVFALLLAAVSVSGAWRQRSRYRFSEGLKAL